MQRVSAPATVLVQNQGHAGEKVGTQLGKVVDHARGVVGDGAPTVTVQVHHDQHATWGDVPAIGGCGLAIPAHPRSGRARRCPATL